MARKLADSRHLAFTVERRRAPRRSARRCDALEGQSPPTSRRLAGRAPRRTSALSEPMAAMAATPRAMQSTKMTKPPAPLRSSRSARRERKRQGQPADGLGSGDAGGGHEAAARRLAPRGGDAAVGEAAPCGRSAWPAQVMGDEEEGGLPVARFSAEQQVHDLGAGGAVEIAGRLVGKDELRAGRERAGDGDALLLAAGELRRENGRRDGRARLRQAPRAAARRHRRGRRTRAAAPRSRCAVMVGTRWKDWKTMPILAAAETRQIVLVERSRNRRRHRDAARVARSSPAMIISSVDLPEPERPTTAIDSPAATFRSNPRNMATGPAREGSVTCTSSSRIAGWGCFRV